MHNLKSKLEKQEIKQNVFTIPCTVFLKNSHGVQSINERFK